MRGSLWHEVRDWSKIHGAQCRCAVGRLSLGTATGRRGRSLILATSLAQAVSVTRQLGAMSITQSRPFRSPPGRHHFTLLPA
eukprot:7381259-Prymnesium_polylepis.1